MNEHDREAYLCTSEGEVVYRNHKKKTATNAVFYIRLFGRETPYEQSDALLMWY